MLKLYTSTYNANQDKYAVNRYDDTSLYTSETVVNEEASKVIRELKEYDIEVGTRYKDIPEIILHGDILYILKAIVYKDQAIEIQGLATKSLDLIRELSKDNDLVFLTRQMQSFKAPNIEIDGVKVKQKDVLGTLYDKLINTRILRVDKYISKFRNLTDRDTEIIKSLFEIIARDKSVSDMIAMVNVEMPPIAAVAKEIEQTLDCSKRKVEHWATNIIDYIMNIFGYSLDNKERRRISISWNTHTKYLVCGRLYKKYKEADIEIEYNIRRKE